MCILLFILLISCVLNLTQKLGTVSVDFLRLWWLYAADPAHRRVAHGVGITAMCWVEGIRRPQPEIGPARRDAMARGQNHDNFAQKPPSQTKYDST